MVISRPLHLRVSFAVVLLSLFGCLALLPSLAWADAADGLDQSSLDSFSSYVAPAEEAGTQADVRADAIASDDAEKESALSDELEADAADAEQSVTAIVSSADEMVGDDATTALAAEVQPDGWCVEDGVAYYYKDGSPVEGWIVADDYMTYGLQRYWMGEGGAMVVSQLINPEEGWWAYATPFGYVVRGTYEDADSGLVYVADNDGRLAGGDECEWVVGDYGDGVQRYWIDPEAHAAVVGRSTDGWDHYTTDAGYVLRGAQNADGIMRWANNDGLLREGWVCTADFGQGFQRYWQENGAIVTSQIVDDGDIRAYATSAGYVVRGSAVVDGNLYVADNDGRLISAGWLVTDALTGSYERYWIENGSPVKSQLIDAGDGWWAYATDTGAVVRGAYYDAATGCTYLGDNDGRLASTDHDGWLVTGAYTSGDLQRYWVENATHTVATGFFQVDDDWYHGNTYTGYVVRGAISYGDSVMVANNDGVLASGWLVGDLFGTGELQRYYFSEQSHVAQTGIFAVDGEEYYGIPGKGYVLRGAETISGNDRYANNDGKLYPLVQAVVDNTATLHTSLVDGVSYLFLPSNATWDNVVLSGLLMGESLALYVSSDEGANQTLIDGDSIDLSQVSSDLDSYGARMFLVCRAGSSVWSELRIMFSAQVAAIYLISDDPENEGREYVESSADHTAKTTGSMIMVDADGTVVYDNDLTQIKGRGNSTWQAADKKPYQIKLSKKTDLLETGDKDNKAKTWVLLANASDTTLVSDMIAYNLAQAYGLSGSPECRFVDLYYDGQYRGSYLLSEKVETGSGRVDIYDLEDDVEKANEGVDLDTLPTAQATNKYGYEFQYVEGAASAEDITGGYIVEWDGYYRSERCWFMTSVGPFTVKTPENLSYEQMKYISEYVCEAVEAASNGKDISSYTGLALSEYIDIESFAKMFNLNEAVLNYDWPEGSTYYYLPQGTEDGLRHVLYAGPVWDFDTAFGTRMEFHETTGFYTDAMDKSEFYHESPSLIAAEAEWYPALSALLAVLNGQAEAGSTGLGSIDDYVALVAQSQLMNEVLWGVDCTNWEQIYRPNHTDYAANIDYLKEFLLKRTAWFDEYYGV